ncbi:hypothetical protein ACHAWT_004982 [Skeletonema menzelii]
MSASIAIAQVLELLLLQDWETLRSNVLSNPTLFRNICSAISACSELNGMTLLHAAVRFNPPLDIVAQMIRICPHLTAATDCLNRTPLHVAAGSKASASLIKLIARAYPAASVVQDEEGKTPLHFACDSSCVLFEDQIDVDENDVSTVSTSDREPPKHESIAALLSISLHAATLEDNEEMSPLEHAIMSNASLKTVKLLQAATRKGMQMLEKEKEIQSRSRSFMTATAMNSLQVQDDSIPASDNCCISSNLSCLTAT